jgi:hypothetical protein
MLENVEKLYEAAPVNKLLAAVNGIVALEEPIELSAEQDNIKCALLLRGDERYKLFDKSEQYAAGFQEIEIFASTEIEAIEIANILLESWRNPVDLNKWCDAVINGVGGWKSYEYHEMIVYVDRDLEIAKWVVRCLASQHCEKAGEVLLAIVAQREQTEDQNR